MLCSAVDGIACSILPDLPSAARRRQLRRNRARSAAEALRWLFVFCCQGISVPYFNYITARRAAATDCHGAAIQIIAQRGT